MCSLDSLVGSWSAYRLIGTFLKRKLKFWSQGMFVELGLWTWLPRRHTDIGGDVVIINFKRNFRWKLSAYSSTSSWKRASNALSPELWSVANWVDKFISSIWYQTVRPVVDTLWVHINTKLQERVSYLKM